MSPPLKKYRVHEVVVFGNTFPIVLCGSGGSQALVTLSNAVLRAYTGLLSSFVTEGGRNGRPKYVRTEVLLQIIETALLLRLKEAVDAGHFDESAMLYFWEKCKVTIRNLPKSFSVDPRFTSCEDFAESEEVDLCTTLGIYLHHAWVVDPQEDPDTAEAIGSKTLTEISEILKLPLGDPASLSDVERNAVKNFMDNTKYQVTPYGLSCLNEKVANLESHLLFRNNRISYLTKCDEKLMVLQDDEYSVLSNPDGLWSVLEEANDDRRLLALDFTPTKHQLKTDAEDEANAYKKQEAIIADEARENKKKSKLSAKQRRKLAKKKNANNSQSEVQPEFTEPTAEELKVSEPSKEERDRLNLLHEQEEEQNKLLQQQGEEEKQEELDDDMSKRFGVYASPVNLQGGVFTFPA